MRGCDGLQDALMTGDFHVPTNNKKLPQIEASGEIPHDLTRAKPEREAEGQRGTALPIASFLVTSA
jgi:hypothetical protein